MSITEYALRVEGILPCRAYSVRVERIPNMYREGRWGKHSMQYGWNVPYHVVSMQYGWKVPNLGDSMQCGWDVLHLGDSMQCG